MNFCRHQRRTYSLKILHYIVELSDNNFLNLSLEKFTTSIKICAVFQSIYSHLLNSTNKLERKLHDDILQYFNVNSQSAHITSSADYQYQNRRLAFEEENKKNSKTQIPSFPKLPNSVFVRKSNSKSMSIPHLGPSALTQVIPSINTTIAPAAEAAELPILPLFRAPSGKNCF